MCAPPVAREVESAYRVEANTVTIDRATPIKFEVAEAQAGDALPLSPVTGRVTTIETLTSPGFAPLSGRVVEAQVRPGDHVKRGQKLVEIRSADLPALELSVRSAQLAVETRTASVARLRTLVDSRAGSVNDLLLGESELAEAKLSLKAAQSRLSSLQVKRADDATYWVLASRSGTVVQLEAASGLQVGPDRGALVTIADLAEVLVVGDVPQRDAVDLHVGGSAQIYVSGISSAPLVGMIEAISEVVDPERQTVPVRVRIANQERRLRPNAFVDLAFSTGKMRSTVLVPAAAVVRDGASAVVFVERRPGEFERRSVVLGRQGRDKVEVSAGLKPGEKVVTTSALLLLNAINLEA